MKDLSLTRRMVLGAMFIALCVVLPVALHAIPDAGTIFLPMHIPVLLCGLICGWSYGCVCGLMGPLLSSLLTGMPPAAILPAMMLECAVYGAVSGLMLKAVRTRSLTADLYLSLTAAMVAGRVVSGIAKALIFAPGITMSAWIASSFVTAAPGIIIQLVLIPQVVRILMKARYVPQRYAKEVTK